MVAPTLVGFIDRDTIVRTGLDLWAAGWLSRAKLSRQRGMRLVVMEISICTKFESWPDLEIFCAEDLATEIGMSTRLVPEGAHYLQQSPVDEFIQIPKL